MANRDPQRRSEAAAPVAGAARSGVTWLVVLTALAVVVVLVSLLVMVHQDHSIRQVAVLVVEIAQEMVLVLLL